jgi:hypothetical protein
MSTGIKNTEVLLDAIREVELEVKLEKTEHRSVMFMSRHQNARQNNNTHLTNECLTMRTVHVNYMRKTTPFYRLITAAINWL